MNKMSFQLYIAGFLFLVLLPATLFAKAALDPYREAKRQGLMIYQHNPYTFYCHIPFDHQGKLRLQPPGELAKRIQWEHIVPVSRFAANRPCWTQALCYDKDNKPFKGRKCCRQKDAIFQKMEADLHNMVPSLPKLNQARKTYNFSESLKNAKKPLEACTFEIDKKNHQVQVEPSLYGFIARTYLYMHMHYGVPLSQTELLQFEQWNRRYAPDLWELTRHGLIADVQGNKNPFIEEFASWK